MIDHFCKLPDPNQPGMRGRSHQCPDCHAEWMVIWHDAEHRNIWMIRVTAEQAAQQGDAMVAEDALVDAANEHADEVRQIMHELAHEDIDPAVIGAYMWTMGRIVGQIISIVHRSHGQAAAVTLAKAWNAFAESAQPYFLAEPCEHHTYKHGG